MQGQSACRCFCMQFMRGSPAPHTHTHTGSHILSPLLSSTCIHPFFPSLPPLLILSSPPSLCWPPQPPTPSQWCYVSHSSPSSPLPPRPPSFHSSQMVTDALARTRGKETGREEDGAKRNKRASVKRPFGCGGGGSEHKAIGLVLLGAKSLSVLISAGKARDGPDQRRTAVCSSALRIFSRRAQVRLDFWQSGGKACARRG